jgi:hypothetical protein
VPDKYSKKRRSSTGGCILFKHRLKSCISFKSIVLPTSKTTLGKKQRSNQSGFCIRARAFWPWGRPQSNQQFSQIPHASAPKSLNSSSFLKNRGDGTTLLVIPPQFALKTLGGCVVIKRSPAGRLNFSLPELSLIDMTLQVIEHALLAPVETHGANVQSRFRKTTGKAAGTAALQSRPAGRYFL